MCRCRLIVRSNVGSADSANFSLKGETSASFANADLDQSATQVIFQVATGRILGDHGLNDQDILIVGGYGVVGLRIAPNSDQTTQGRVVVAGRSLARADNAARGIGHGARGR
jgi:hypothetical protein